MKSLRFGWSLVLSAALALVLASSANAQASRTWVSGVGDDANPCSRTAPCKTFAGAISKTSSAGEIDCLDPSGFGALTITKPIVIDCQSGVGAVGVSGTNGITINSAGATDSITLRNLTLDGLGTGLIGISIMAGNTVHLENIKIHNFITFGVQVNAAAAVSLSMDNVTIMADNATGGGMSVSTTSGVAAVDLQNVRIWNCHPGLQGRDNSIWMVSNSDLSFNGVAVKAFEAGTTMNVIASQINDNAVAVQSVAGSTVSVMGSTMSENVMALNPNGGATLSDGKNEVNGNGSNGSPTGTTTTI